MEPVKIEMSEKTKQAIEDFFKDKNAVDTTIAEEVVERINHPAHYNQGSIEVIDYIESLGIAEDFCSGNAIKYISRYKYKGTPLDDLKKAQWYIARLVKILESKKDGK